MEHLYDNVIIEFAFPDTSERKALFSKITSPLGSIDMNKVATEPKRADPHAWRMTNWGVPRTFVSFAVHGNKATIELTDCDPVLFVLQLLKTRPNIRCTVRIEGDRSDGNEAIEHFCRTFRSDLSGIIRYDYDDAYGNIELNSRSDIPAIAERIRMS